MNSIATFMILLMIKCPVLTSDGYIPKKYTCEGESISPPLTIDNLPPNTKSLAIIMDDPDATHGTFDHWVVWNIPPGSSIAEATAEGTAGLNGKKENKYTGPCPPSGVHHYHFKVYALDTKLSLPKDTDKKALEEAMKSHILGSGELVALYQKQ